MAHPPKKRLEVIATYAVTGNASEAAREQGVSDRTARRWVRDAITGRDEEGHEFLTEHGRGTRASVIDALERALFDKLSDLTARLGDDAWAQSFKGDPTPQYINSLANLYGKLTDAERLDLEKSGALQPSGPRIVFEVGPEEDEPPPAAAEQKPDEQPAVH